MANVMDEIRKEISGNKIMVYMKGTPSLPQCGFSARTVAILEDLGYPFAAVNVLAEPEKREAIKVYSEWPTIPQVYINGQFVGGCDIMMELYESGELKRILGEAFADAPAHR
jgi:monothiol glutaredoxin